MSRATEILTEKYTLYPNDLIRNRNDFMTKNERHLMIFLWDKLNGYKTPNNYLSYSVILRHCKDFPKNNAKLSQAIKSLERKGLLGVFRENRNMNKYFIGIKQVRVLQWYGKHFTQWKDGVIESAIESAENEIENTKEEKQQEKNISTETEKPIRPLSEKIYLYELTENEFIELYPGLDFSICYSMHRNKTLEQFKKNSEIIIDRRNNKIETETQINETINKEPENRIEGLTKEEINDLLYGDRK